MKKIIAVQDIQSCVSEVADEAKDLYLGHHIFSCNEPPTAKDFHRNWISKNLPCVFKNATAHWPALKKWDPHYLKEKIGSKQVTVAVTPNGLADAVTDNKFVLPEERIMKMEDFLDITKQDTGDSVFYIQKQNSNMTEEFRELMNDIDPNISWAYEALDKEPDAVNFWMGQGKAVTSLHKDHYENLYCVIKGEKIFTLYPPSDRLYIPYENYPVAQYKYENNQWIIETNKIVGDSSTVPWISVDPLHPNYEVYPQFKHAQPYTCKVQSGDVLYLPSLWFHHVQQSDLTIAVNYWYDMEFNVNYTLYQLLDKLADLIS